MYKNFLNVSCVFFSDLQEGILELWIVLKERVSNLEDSLSPYLRESESTMPAILLGREVLHRMYKFAFEV